MLKKTVLLEQLRNLKPHTKLAVVFLLAAIVLALSSNSKSPSTSLSISEEENNLSTFIPAGQRLVPIEILNSGALDSILGRYGFVDLYLEGQNRPFARAVRIVKSIDGSGDWAALVSENLADELMAAGAQFRVAVQANNIKEANQRVRQETRRRRTIVYEGE